MLKKQTNQNQTKILDICHYTAKYAIPFIDYFCLKQLEVSDRLWEGVDHANW